MLRVRRCIGGESGRLELFFGLSFAVHILAMQIPIQCIQSFNDSWKEGRGEKAYHQHPPTPSQTPPQPSDS